MAARTTKAMLACIVCALTMACDDREGEPPAIPSPYFDAGPKDAAADGARDGGADGSDDAGTDAAIADASTD